MPAQLDNPKIISATVTRYQIMDYTVDDSRKELHVSYNELDSAGNIVAEKGITIDGPGFTAVFLAAQEIAKTMTNKIYKPLKRAIYKVILNQSGKTGVIT